MAATSVIATCLMLAAQNYNVPPAVMLGIMHVEGGAIGQAAGPNDNGTYDLGPMQINTSWVPQLARFWNVNANTALNMVKNDACINVNVAAWILRQRLNESGNLTLAIAHYHSKTPRFGYVYARKVIVAMKRMDLIQD
jgi:soluble lytic murein transglycosylase-like protein